VGLSALALALLLAFLMPVGAGATGAAPAFEIETGPGRHGMGEQEYLYFKEPGGNRVEINTGGYRLYVPDWKTTKWTPAQGSQTFYRNIPMPESMLEGTPNAAPQEGAGVEGNPWDAASVH
jgi:hypothetical protein